MSMHSLREALSLCDQISDGTGLFILERDLASKRLNRLRSSRPALSDAYEGHLQQARAGQAAFCADFPPPRAEGAGA